jgi:hypothetical protein
MVFAAAVSDLAAVVMALVAVFIACMAVDIVRAEDVALVAAAVILLAAEVTFVAADETVRAADAVDGALAEPVERVDLALLLLLLVLLALRCGRLAARAGVLLLVDLVRALAEVRRAVVLVVVRAGTDLPPSRSITEVLFHQPHRFTHLIAAYLQNNGRKQTKIAAISPPERGRLREGRRRRRRAGGGRARAWRGRPTSRPRRSRQRQTLGSPPTTPALLAVPRGADSSADHSCGRPPPGGVACLVPATRKQTGFRPGRPSPNSGMRARAPLMLSRQRLVPVFVGLGARSS